MPINIGPARTPLFPHSRFEVRAPITAIRSLIWALALCACGVATAQNYPNRPVRLIVGFTPGGGVDINARLLAPKLSEYLGQPVIVENRPGAGTNIANEHVARSAPDGHTLLVNTSAVTINMSLYKNLTYDTLRDLAPVSIFSESANLLVVHAGVQAKNLAELVALMRGNPGKLNYSSAGSGTTQHLAAELFKLRTQTAIVHVPYKGTAPSLTAVIAGEVDMTFANVPAILSHVKSGRLRPLASTGAKRSALMSDVPTMKEAGVEGVEVPVWYGVFAPAGTPREIVRTLADSIVKATHSADVKQRLAEQGAEPVGSTPEEFAQLVREEVVKWAEVVRVSGARVE
jgi:tripartite-type tricarboxylate transporter receptor subunit TctC